jgi:hypothetical protein
LVPRLLGKTLESRYDLAKEAAMRSSFVVFLALESVVGCSSENDRNPAVDKCELFANTWCTHAISCLVQVNRLNTSQEQEQLDACKRVAIAAVPCEKAVDVGASFDQCLSNVDAMPCQTWDVDVAQLSTITPPSSCFGVVKVQK